jgi:hypothetical protein
MYPTAVKGDVDGARGEDGVAEGKLVGTGEGAALGDSVD